MLMEEEILQNFAEAIRQNKYLLLNGNFSECSKFYAFTNENLNSLFKQLDFADTLSALTICGSGDHIFNLINSGVYEIDAVDTNSLAEHYALGFKLAAMKKFTYVEFLDYMEKMLTKEISASEQYNLLLEIIDEMPSKTASFFLTLFKNSIDLQKNNHAHLSLMKFLAMPFPSIEVAIKLNKYLANEEEYERTRHSLEQASISFQTKDIFDLAPSKSYDKIFLSNIFDYLYRKYGNFWNYSDHKDEIENYFDQLLSSKGEIALAYIYNFYSYQSESFRTKPFNLSNTKIDDLKAYQKILVPSINSYNNYSANSNIADTVIIREKNS